MNWPAPANAGGFLQVPRAHPELARHLSLTVPAPPVELRTGEETAIIGILTNVGHGAMTVTHAGGASALLWEEGASAAVGGELGWSTLVPKRVVLLPGKRLDLRVHVVGGLLNSLSLRNHPPSPLPPGVYRLRVYGHLSAATAVGEAWDGWVLSPFYRVAVVDLRPAESGEPVPADGAGV